MKKIVALLNIQRYFHNKNHNHTLLMAKFALIYLVLCQEIQTLLKRLHKTNATFKLIIIVIKSIHSILSSNCHVHYTVMVVAINFDGECGAFKV